jgi:hypothetical protein
MSLARYSFSTPKWRRPKAYAQDRLNNHTIAVNRLPVPTPKPQSLYSLSLPSKVTICNFSESFLKIGPSGGCHPCPIMVKPGQSGSQNPLLEQQYE